MLRSMLLSIPSNYFLALKLYKVNPPSINLSQFGSLTIQAPTFQGMITKYPLSAEIKTDENGTYIVYYFSADQIQGKMNY